MLERARSLLGNFMRLFSRNSEKEIDPPLFSVFHKKATKIPKDLFSPEVNSKLLIVLIICFGLFVLITILLAVQASASLSDIWSVMKSRDFVIFLISLFSAILVTILASFIYSSIDRNDLRRKLNYFQNVSHPDLMSTIVENLSFFQKRYERDRVEYFTIKRHPDFPDELVQCELEFSYYKILPDRNVRFTIVREGNQAHDLTRTEGINDLVSFYNLYELIQTFDETDIPDHIKNNEKFDQSYSISDPLLNRSERLKLDNSNMATPLDRIGQIPPSVSIEDFVHFTYSIRFPLSRNDFYKIQFEYPNYGFELHIDYDDLKDELDLFVDENLSSRLSVERMGHVSLQREQIAHQGWLLPKSAIMIMWWDEASGHSGGQGGKDNVEN